jgi:hypothetical protein
MPQELQRLMLSTFLYEDPVSIDYDAFLTGLRKYCGPAEHVSKPEDASQLFVFPEHMVTFSDAKSVPAQVMIIPVVDREIDLSAVEGALRHSWDWPDAKEVISRCKFEIIVNELFATTLERKIRLKLYQGALQALIELMPPRAIWWPSSDRVVNPDFYVRSKQGDDPDPLYPAINVRFFRIDGSSNEYVMDTFGLYLFDLPDIQCHFKNLDLNAVGSLLGSYALYLFDQGDVIQDGHTVQGLSVNDKWRCQHEKSLVEPHREVLDINPGPPYEAGKRN